MKKQILASAIASVLLLSGAAAPIMEPMQAYAESVSTKSVTQVNVSGTTSDGFTYSGVKNRITLSNGCTFYVGAYATITGYTGSKTDLVIPSSIDGCTVTAIGSHAFSRHGRYKEFRSEISSVTLPDSITDIAGYAFYESGISNINFPTSLRSIGECAFAYTELKSVVIPNSVQYVGELAFTECTSLTNVKLSGAKKIDNAAFSSCTALKSVWIPKGCEAGKEVFIGCSALTVVNGAKAFTEKKDANGIYMPVLTTDSIRRQVITEFFSDSTGVKFVDDYCTKVCDYVVATEIKPWMSDNIKARQLYDWLIRNVRYEDEKDGETKNDANNHVPSSVFLSCGLSNDGIGETVCEGYAKAYTMLLAQANIESYVLEAGATKKGEEGHAWNLVKIEDEYYQCDVTWDEDVWVKGVGKYTRLQMEGTSYKYFLKTAAKMDELHNGKLKTGYTASVAGHPLLEKYSWENGETALNNSTTIEFQDKNEDGILDHDVNLNGVTNYADGNYVNGTKKFFNNGFDLKENKLDQWLLYLKTVNLSPTDVWNLAKQGKTIS